MAVDERLRRLAPIVTGGAGFGIAALKMRAGGVSEREVVACALIAVAAALVAYAVATVRGSAGVIAGAVAGLWLAATAAGAAAAAAAEDDNRQQATGDRQQATGREENGKRETGNGKRETGREENGQRATGNGQRAMGTAAASGAELAMAVAAIVAALCLLLARADKDDGAPRMFLAPIAAGLIIFEPRAWALAGVVAGLVAWRERGRRRWLAAAPAIAAVVGGVITMMAVFDRAPAWAPNAPHVRVNAWLETAVDLLGPVAIVVGAIGVAVASNDRRARWTSMAIIGALLAALPLTAATPSTALVGLAMALGMALAAVAVRVGRTRNQALVGAALAAVLVTQLLI